MTNTASGWAELKKRLDALDKPVRTFNLCQNPDIRDRFHEARHADEQAKRSLAALPKDIEGDAKALYVREAADTAKELAAAKKAYDAHVITLRFTALDRLDLQELQAKNPPSEEEEAKGDEFAMETFAPALVSAASLDGMPVDDARTYLNTWSTADAGALWQAAWSIQRQQRTDLGKG
ncbi:hypothetical protein [Streptomyces sp. NPDC047868]|uniref:hypothetical protein n=1 Tax=Streptomyces sp. NPDC047868 TaxID=3155480 RepID=UPI0034572E38